VSEPDRRLGAVRLLVLDVDGVMTDGRLYFGPGGEELKAFHVRDGLGLKQVMRAGIQVVVLSGRRSEAVEARCRELGITHLEQGCEDKAQALGIIAAVLRTPLEECACIVDDTSDLPLARAVGMSVAVADAHPEVRCAVQRVTEHRGGEGAVREVCDWLLAARGVRP
jgi:3-deoxy-D-manno-octulosonate 8-phosphate phosphatase (KDO 8-P phosphatase)